MASACLPFLFQAVEIDGESYWDGGYSANPALLPLVRAAPTADLLIVQINPRQREKVPVSARDIAGRAHEITFNAAQSAELRAIDFINQMIDRGRLPLGVGRREARIRLHRIVMAAETFDPRSRLNNNFVFFKRLHKLGERAARRFLETHFKNIGARGTIDDVAERRAEVA